MLGQWEFDPLVSAERNQQRELLCSVNVVSDFPEYDNLPASCPTLPNRNFWSSSLASTGSFYILRAMQMCHASAYQE